MREPLVPEPGYGSRLQLARIVRTERSGEVEDEERWGRRIEEFLKFKRPGHDSAARLRSNSRRPLPHHDHNHHYYDFYFLSVNICAHSLSCARLHSHIWSSPAFRHCLSPRWRPRLRLWLGLPLRRPLKVTSKICSGRRVA